MLGQDWIRQVAPLLGDEEAEAAGRVVKSGWVTEGRESQAFVEELSALVGAPYGVLAPNGTLALALGLMALGVGPGDEVLVPDTTFVGSATAVLLTGARPVFVDVDPINFQIDIAHAERFLSHATRAIMPVHLYGTACDMDAVTDFASSHGLKVIEDAAQGVGVHYKGRHVGSIGDVGCFSFFADKTVTTGEGGFVACRDAAIYERLRLFRNQGRLKSGTFIHPSVGYNFRITDIQSAIGRIQLRKLGAIAATKRVLYETYVEELRDVGSVRILQAAKDAELIPFRCVILSDDAQGLMTHLAENRVEPRSFFYPLHLQPAFRELTFGRCDDADYPNAMMGYRRGVCLPIHCALSREDVSRIAALIRSHHLARASRV